MEPALVKKKLRDETLRPTLRKTTLHHAIDIALHRQNLASHLSDALTSHHTPHRADTIPPHRTQRQQIDKPDAAQANASAPNAAYSASLDSLPDATTSEPLAVVLELRERWRAHLEDSLARICEGGVPLMRVNAAALPPLAPLHAEGRRLFKGLYEAEELLELIAGAAHDNVRADARSSWGLLPLHLRAASLGELTTTLVELEPGVRHVGIDDDLRGWFAEERNLMAQRVLRDGYRPLVRLYLRCGAPRGTRGALWMAALGVRVGPLEARHYAALRDETSRVGLVLDEAVSRDASLPLFEEDYFVFSESATECALCFLRDASVADAASARGFTVAAVSSTTGRRYLYPPSGALPPRGLSQYFYPLHFCYTSTDELYTVGRALWARYWCRLHTLSSRPHTLLPLLALFERLVQEHAAVACAHLKRLGLHPTSIAFPWILYAFSAHLPCDQLLLLWDRVIGFDSLELLPLLAVAIFSFRTRALSEAVDSEEGVRILTDASELRVVPLLQTMLWSPRSLFRPPASGSSAPPPGPPTPKQQAPAPGSRSSTTIKSRSSRASSAAARSERAAA